MITFKRYGGTCGGAESRAEFQQLAGTESELNMARCELDSVKRQCNEEIKDVKRRFDEELLSKKIQKKKELQAEVEQLKKEVCFENSSAVQHPTYSRRKRRPRSPRSSCLTCKL